LLWSGRHAQPPPNDPRLNRAVRTVLVVLATAFAGLAVAFWITTDGPVPFEVAPLGARFLAAWLAFFAVLAGWPARRPTLSEARVPLLSLVAYGVGGLLAAAVHPGHLEAGPSGYLAALVGVVAIASFALIRGSRLVWQARPPAFARTRVHGRVGGGTRRADPVGRAISSDETAQARTDGGAESHP
jgi:hypothetical protein